MLRNRPIPAGQWVIVRSAKRAFDAGGEVPATTRVDRSQQNLMPQIRATARTPRPSGPRPALAATGSSGWTSASIPRVTQLTNLVELGSDSDTAIEAQPSEIVIDRCYLHGNDAGNYRRGVAMNGARLAVDRIVSRELPRREHRFAGDRRMERAGPFKIVNNFLEAASENIMFGGSDPAIHGLVPSDIEIRRNLSTKRLSWRTASVAGQERVRAEECAARARRGQRLRARVDIGAGRHRDRPEVDQPGRPMPVVRDRVCHFQEQHRPRRGHGLSINARRGRCARVPLPRRANHIRVQNVLFREIGGASVGRRQAVPHLWRRLGRRDHPRHVDRQRTGILDPRDRAT